MYDILDCKSYKIIKVVIIVHIVGLFSIAFFSNKYLSYGTVKTLAVVFFLFLALLYIGLLISTIIKLKK